MAARDGMRRQWWVTAAVEMQINKNTTINYMMAARWHAGTVVGGGIVNNNGSTSLLSQQQQYHQPAASTCQQQ